MNRIQLVDKFNEHIYKVKKRHGVRSFFGKTGQASAFIWNDLSEVILFSVPKYY